MNAESLAKITSARQTIAACIEAALADIEKGNSLDTDTSELSRRRSEANAELAELVKSTEPDAAAELNLATIKTTSASIAALRAEIGVLDNAIRGREQKAADFLREGVNRGNAIAVRARDAVWSAGGAVAGHRMEEIWNAIAGWAGAPATIPAAFKDHQNSPLVILANQDPRLQQFVRVYRELTSTISWGAPPSSFLPLFQQALELVTETETLFAPPPPVKAANHPAASAGPRKLPPAGTIVAVPA